MNSHKRFKVGQAAIIRNKMGQILILKKNDSWMLPGGRLEENETCAEGLLREIREETGIVDLLIKKVLDADTSDDKDSYVTTFLCEIENNPKIVLSKEHQEFAWIKPEDAELYKFWHPKILKRISLLLENGAG